VSPPASIIASQYTTGYIHVVSRHEPIIGLDVGASKCVAAAVDAAGWPRVLADSAGRKIVPSIVSFHPEGNVLVGDEAMARRAEDPANTITGISRLVGHKASSREVVEVVSRSPNKFRVGPGDQPVISTRAGELGVPDLLALLIDHMRRLADGALDTDTSRCVLTVPALYGPAQRQQVAHAATLAGVQIEGMIEDPVAAALAYGYSRATPPIVCVFDFGGGKFECSVLEVRGGDATPRVLGSAGDTFLGGDDVDARIADYTVRAFWQVHRVDLRADPTVMPRLMEAAERAKIELSARGETVLSIPAIASSKDGRPLDLALALTRDLFAQAVDDVVRKTFAVCAQACSAAGLELRQIDEILLLGGMTKVPSIREQVHAFFGKQPRTDVNADVGVALGAAIWAQRQQGGREDTVKRRVTARFGSDAQQAQPSEVATEEQSGPIQLSGARVGRISTKKMFTAVMAAQADVSFGEAAPVTEPQPIQMIEVMASNLAISTISGYCEEVIGRETPLPVEKTRVFSTSKDNQQVVKVSLCQGDSRRFAENVPLGTIVLDGLPARPRGKVKIAVTFAAAPDGVLVASARDEESGRVQSIKVTLAGQS
jgi:molecular chaperone DnaK (HSP70)